MSNLDNIEGSGANRPGGNGIHRREEKGSAPDTGTVPAIKPTWEDWKEVRLAAFTFAVGVQSGVDGHDLQQLEKARQLARQALAVASALKEPYEEREVAEIGSIVLGHRTNCGQFPVIIGGHVLNLLSSFNPIEAPRFAEWLTVWATQSSQQVPSHNGSHCEEWPERYRQGLKLVEPQSTRTKRR